MDRSTWIEHLLHPRCVDRFVERRDCKSPSDWECLRVKFGDDDERLCDSVLRRRRSIVQHLEFHSASGKPGRVKFCDDDERLCIIGEPSRCKHRQYIHDQYCRFHRFSVDDGYRECLLLGRRGYWNRCREFQFNRSWKCIHIKCSHDDERLCDSVLRRRRSVVQHLEQCNHSALCKPGRFELSHNHKCLCDSVLRRRRSVVQHLEQCNHSALCKPGRFELSHNHKCLCDITQRLWNI